MQRTRIITVLVTFILTVILLNSHHGINGIPAPPFTSSREPLKISDIPQNVYIVFLNGLGCSLQGSNDLAMGFKRTRMALVDAGFTDDEDRFLLYSYTGGKVIDSKWFPAHYSPRDTGQSLGISVSRLYDLIEEYSQARPDARYILVGHSLGGRIALDYISTTTPEQKQRIKGVITLNSPLLGVDCKFPLYLLRILDHWGSVWASTAVKELLQEYPNRQDYAYLRKSTIRELQRNGLRIATFATYQDILVPPQTGYLTDEWGSPVTEGSIINADRYILQDFTRHMQIVDHQVVVSYIAAILKD